MGDKVLLFLNIAVAAVSLAFAVLMLARGFKKLRESKNESEKAQAMQTIMETMDKVHNIFVKIPSFICQAEDLFGAGNGTRKQYFAMKEIENECIKYKIDFDTYKEQFKCGIENVLATPQKKNTK